MKDPGAQEIVNIANKILQAKEEFFGKVTSSLRTVLTALSIGNMGKIIGHAKSNRFIQRLEKGQRVILIVQTGSMLSGKVSDMMTRILISMIQSFIGRRFASGKKIDPPMSIYIDEFSNACYIGIEDLFNKAGGAGFKYSDAMTKAGGTWSFEELDGYIENPKKFLPGNRMAFAGIRKAKQRADLLVYMNAQGPEPQPLP